VRKANDIYARQTLAEELREARNAQPPVTALECIGAALVIAGYLALLYVSLYLIAG